MLVCNHCGTKVQHCDLGYVTEAHGERHLNTACKCGGDFVPATQCAVCGEWFDGEGLLDVCEKCLYEHETVETALAIGEVNTTTVDGINGAIAYLLTPKQMNKILEKWVEENFTDKSRPIVDYCEDDLPYFSEWVEGKVNS